MDSSYNKRQSVKLGQVIQNFFGKAVQIVLQSRVPSSWNEGEENKVNKWFNLYLPTLSTSAKEDLRLWKIQPQATTSSSVTSSSSDVASLPPMIIETYLDLRKLGPRQTVVLKDDTGNPWTVAKGGAKKQEVVLERWLIEFDPLEVSGFNVDELPFIYKQAIVLFRSLYAFTRLMPAYKLYRNLNQQSQLTSSLSIGIKVLDGKQPISSKGRVGLSKSIIPHQMLVTESHMQQKHFSPIQTTMGTLKVSIAYRTHHNFCVHDSEEILSTHFISIDKTDDKKKRVSIASMSVSPKQLSQSQSHLLTPMLLLPLTHLQLLLHLLRESHSHPHSHSHSYQSQGSTGSGGGSGGGSTPGASAPVAGSSIPVTPLRPSIQPFKIGSISNSPPVSSSLERRISITSNKSTSNASLVAMLRNARNSTSSSNTTANIPITNTSHRDSFPKSVSSSHADDSIPFSPGGIEGGTPTPRFSSSFGSRASRRYSNTSIRQSSITHDSTSLTATLSGLVSSSGAPLSGIYIDDDISDFVKMIDSKSDLRFHTSYNPETSSSKLGGGGSTGSVGGGSGADALSRFQSMKQQHQQLGESVSASLVLQFQNFQQQQQQQQQQQLLQQLQLPQPLQLQKSVSPSILVNPSRSSSRKSSMHSPPASVGSYENSHIPSIHSRLRESHSVDEKLEDSIIGASRRSSFNHSNNSFLRSSSKLISSPVTSTTIAHAHKTTTPASNTNTSDDGVSGLATTPSKYKKQIRYENVFEDDDDDDDIDGENGAGADFYLSKKSAPLDGINRNSRGADDDDDEDDDLLFTMSDMNLIK